MEKIRLGISACLLGESVRYDGGHALDRFLRDTLGTYIQYVPVCPEVECEFGIPRETLRLAGDPKRPRLVTGRTGIDHTDRMEAWAAMQVAKIEQEDLSGFIFKSGSPSSGMERVKVYDNRGVPRKIEVGVFARIFMEHFPLTPVEEDGRLHDPILRENFIYRRGLTPLIVPTTLMNHYVRKYHEPYLKGQIYLNPHPVERQLRNHV